jgi:putative redox protein
MVEIAIAYQGGLRCRAEHGPSGVAIQTDAPLDNHGRGELFSPTDLVAAALGSCILTILGILAERHAVDLSGARAHVAKEMTSAPPRRIARLTVNLSLPATVPAELRPAFEKAARGCPVLASLHPEIEETLTFTWDAA